MKQYLSRIFSGTRKEFVNNISCSLTNCKKEFIVTANPEILMKSDTNPTIRNLLLSDTVSIVPDGISIVKAMHKLHLPVNERITGVDLAEELLRIAGQKRLTVYLLGAAEEVVRTLVQKEQQKYPDSTYHYHNGYHGDKDKIFAEIKSIQPDLIIVALGVPAQELLIAKHYPAFTRGVFIGVGGSFDVLSGHKMRAPKFFIRTNTEWLYRILREPSRIKRFYESNIKFMRHVK